MSSIQTGEERERLVQPQNDVVATGEAPLQRGSESAGLDISEDARWQKELSAAGACAILGLAAAAASAEFRLLFYALAYLAGSWFPAQEMWTRVKKRVFDVHFLMLLVAVGSATIGAWGEGAVLLFLFSLSGALETFAFGRTQREIRSLYKSAPKEALLLDAAGHEHPILVSHLRPGMKLLIRPGDMFPADLEITRGQSAADESNLTGESAPVEKNPGDSAWAGTLNIWGMLEGSVLRPADQSALHRVIDLIHRAQAMKAPSQRFTEKFSSVYTASIIALCALMFFAWWLAFGHPAFIAETGQRSAFYSAMTLLVVASPCALALSIPTAVLAAIAWAAKHGILFRGGGAIENLAKVSTVALDKTGTLTTGDLRVDAIESFPPGRELELLSQAAALERLSTHPLARAVTRHARQLSLQPMPVENFESIAGMGLAGTIAGQPVLLGKKTWIEEKLRQSKLPAPIPDVAQLSLPKLLEPGISEIWVATPAFSGRLILRDQIRPSAKDLIQELRLLGLKPLVLTGDKFATAEALRGQLDLANVQSELTPEDKLKVLRGLIQNGERVAMVGDGVNDAPSLAAANVGVAMGARGSDSALEQADVVLMNDKLENFITAYQLSARAGRIIRQNLAVSLGAVVVLVIAAFFQAIPLSVGVMLHEGSTVLVVLNSLRLLATPSSTPPSALAAP